MVVCGCFDQHDLRAWNFGLILCAASGPLLELTWASREDFRWLLQSGGDPGRRLERALLGNSGPLGLTMHGAFARGVSCMAELLQKHFVRFS